MSGVRRMQKSDIPRVVDLWRRARPHDHVDGRSLEQFMSSSPFFKPELALVATEGGEITGALIATVRGEDEGRIPLFFVSAGQMDSGAADSLLGRALRAFEESGMSSVEAGTAWETGLSDCGYDTRYTDILATFLRNGFRRVCSDEQLDVDIIKGTCAPVFPQWASDAKRRLEKEGFSFRVCSPALRGLFLSFILEHFGDYGGWCTRAGEYVESKTESGFHLLALSDETIVGFTECVHDVSGRPGYEWYLYATGVRSDLRRRKIGSVLLYASLAEVRRRGGEAVFVGEAPLDFYHVLGGKVFRKYMVLRRLPGGPEPA